MQIDLEREENEDDYFDRLKSSLPKSSTGSDLSSNETLTKKDFTYAISLLDDKINALYKLCRYISDQQQKNNLSLQKLVMADELSDDFWNVSILIYLISLF